MFLMLFYSYCITWQNTLFFFQKFQLLRKRPVKIVLDGRQIFLIPGVKRSLSHVNPPYFQRAAPQVRRRVPSSA